MRSFFAPLFVAGALALGITACGAPVDATDDSAESSSEALTTLGKSLVGSFTRVDGKYSPNKLTLAADGTYSALTNVVCVAAPCDPVASAGKWTVTGTAAAGTLRLAPTGAAATTYNLKLASTGALTLTTADSRRAVSHFTKVVVPETCGGIGALKCPTGKECVYADGPVFPDKAGECHVQGERGTFCGGIGGLKCNTGLTCILDDSSVADSGGKCRAPGDLGTFCGGIGGLKCNTGLTCVLTESGHTDLGGVCSL